MLKEQSYVILCAPSGSGLRTAKEKFEDIIDIHIEDIEDTLCNLANTKKALLKAEGRDSLPEDPDWPRMDDVTWNLSRSQVLAFWKEALEQAFQELNKSNKTIKCISCHLIYYSGRRDEFYSPVNTDLLKNNIYNFKPTHILLLIDDVYDMYLELSKNKSLFNPKDRIPRMLSNIAKDEGVSIKNLSPCRLASFCLEWQIGVMSHLLSWRLFEIVIAEKLAAQLNTNFLVWGRKQLKSAAALWLKKDKPISIYISHPIARVRRRFRETKSWDGIVGQCNELQYKLLNKEFTCILPSAIDEYRIQRKKTEGSMVLKEPILEERWELPASIDQLIYSLPDTAVDVNHEKILEYKKWDNNINDFIKVDFSKAHDLSDFLCERADAVLGSFERQIEMQISSRDHLFVAWTNGILIFRSLFMQGKWSNGVQAEIAHWRIIARHEKGKRAVFIHLDEDVEKMFSDIEIDPLVDRRKEIENEIIEIIKLKYGYGEKKAKEILDHIEKNQPLKLLDKGPTTFKNISKIKENLEEYKIDAERRWLFEKLSGRDLGVEVDEKQISVWVLNDINDLENKYNEISLFFREGVKPVNTGLERWPKS